MTRNGTVAIPAGDLAIQVSDLVMRFPAQQGWRALFKPEPGKHALRGVSLSVSRGEIFGLLGPNGAGKTTLVKILSTLTIPTAGQALVSGLDVVKSSLDVRARVGVVYGDERTLYWRLSGLDNLLFYAALYHIPSKVARKRALELLDMVGLSKAANVRVHHYSSGMKQRASIARGLLNDPEILIMDEPTRSLDPIAAHELRQLVKDRVASSRRTVLIATNIMAEAEFLCDRIAFINNGQIQMTGEIDYLRRLLESEELYEVTLGRFAEPILQALESMAGIHAANAVHLYDDVYQIELSVDSQTTPAPEIIRTVVAAGGDVWSCGQRKLTLDEMFRLVVDRSRKTGAAEKVMT